MDYAVSLQPSSYQGCPPPKKGLSASAGDPRLGLTVTSVSQWRHPPPPPELVLILKTYAKCAWPGPIAPPLECGRRHTGNVQGGGGCLWMSKSGCVFQFLGGRMTSHGQCPGGVCACECPRVGVFFNFGEGRWRDTGNVQGGGGACECPRVGVFYNFLEGGWRHTDNVQGGGALPPPPFRKSCIRACY